MLLFLEFIVTFSKFSEISYLPDLKRGAFSYNELTIKTSDFFLQPEIY
jgi:hypothetical protein